MANGHHSMETYQRADGKRGWRIKVDDDIVATDGGQGYNNEQDCLAGLFGNFFGTWDESFLELYEKWQKYAGSQYTVPPEAEAGIPVHVVPDRDGPNYEADTPDEEDDE